MSLNIIIRGVSKVKKSDMWLTILASVGVGAAAYYTISKSDQPINKAIESVTPMISGMTNNNSNNTGNSSNSGQLGQHGMS